jgi:predicted enzyme related to lactoylglutathione lyase
MDMGPMGMYHFIEHDGVGVGAVFTRPAEMPMASWTYYFRVASIDAAKTLIENNGGRVMMGPHQVPDDEWIIMGADPQGAMFALVGAK